MTIETPQLSSNAKLNDSAGTILDSTLEPEIQRLAGLSELDYERQRKTVAKELQLRVTILDALVAFAKSDAAACSIEARDLTLNKPASWPEPVNGAVLLGDTAA